MLPKIRTSFLCTIPSAVVTQAFAQAGADTVVIDQEHGAVGPENLHAMIASTAGTNCRPLVRVGKCDEAMVKLASKNGTKLRSGFFENGKQVGEWTTYDANGNPYNTTKMKG